MPHRLACLDDPHFDMAPVKDWGSMSEDKEQPYARFLCWRRPDGHRSLNFNSVKT